MSAWEFEYFSPEGRAWPLAAHDHHGVFIQEGGMPNLAARRGETVMSGEIQVIVAGSLIGKSNSEVMAAFRQDFDDELYGTMVARSKEYYGELVTRLRLGAESSISDPEWQPDSKGHVTFSVPVESDRQRWTSEESFDGPACLVENYGVGAMLWPRVMWRQGGALVMPSGARLSLPSLSEPRVIDFDPNKSGLVTDLSGVVDEGLWVQLRGFYFEGVPRRERRKYLIPSGAKLFVDVAHREPWR